VRCIAPRLCSPDFVEMYPIEDTNCRLGHTGLRKFDEVNVMDLSHIYRAVKTRNQLSESNCGQCNVCNPSSTVVC
jgi:hypothetical protein